MVILLNPYLLQYYLFFHKYQAYEAAKLVNLIYARFARWQVAGRRY